MKKDNNKIQCPKCKGYFENPNELKCGGCGFVPVSRDHLWKAANMGKQRGKPEANRDGKK